MAKWKELGELMKVELEVSLALEGGSVLVTVADETQGARLTTLVTDLIKSREGRFGVIGKEDVGTLEEVAHELRLAASLIDNRVELERSRAAVRGEA